MHVLMFSMERALLGEKSLGDAVERHKRYAEVKLEGKEIDELNIVVFAKKGYKKEQLSDKVFVYPTDSRWRWTFFWDAYKIGKQIYRDSPYELVIGDFLTGFSAWLLKCRFKVKFLMHFHGDFWGNKEGLEGKWHNWFLLFLSKFLARQADGIRVVSGGIKKKLVKKGIDKAKIAVINTPTSIHLLDNPDMWTVGKLREKYENRKVVLFVGRLEEVKNVDMLIRVFKEIKEESSNFQVPIFKKISKGDNNEAGQKDCVLVIIGDGSERKSLEKLVGELGLRKDVCFEGKVGVGDWKNYFEIASFLVLPSKSESFGNVLALAGAAGVPVVATKTTGAKDIVKDGETGVLVPIDSHKKFKEAIMDILSNPEKACRMGQAARVYCREKFDPEKTTKRIVEWWWEVVSSR